MSSNDSSSSTKECDLVVRSNSSNLKMKYQKFMHNNRYLQCFYCFHHQVFSMCSKLFLFSFLLEKGIGSTQKCLSWACQKLKISPSWGEGLVYPNIALKGSLNLKGCLFWWICWRAMGTDFTQVINHAILSAVHQVGWVWMKDEDYLVDIETRDQFVAAMPSLNDWT